MELKVDIKKWSIPTPTQSIFLHIGFWLSIIVFLTIIDRNPISISQKLLLETINIGFYALIVYVNYYLIFPKYFKDKKLLPHLFWLLLVTIMITPVKSLLLYITTSNPNIQGFFLNNQSLIFLSTFFVGFCSSIYFVMTDWIKSQREKQELAKETLQSELKFLRSQINPHFLFNTLNSLYALTLKKSDLAPEIVLKLSEMMRYMLYDCNEKQVPIEKELAYIANYLELERLRHGSKMDIDLTIDGHINGQQIAPLMFIPFIENCFKHGISNSVNAGYVNVDIRVNEGLLQLKVENSKAQLMPSKVLKKKSGGIGLMNIKRRLEILYPNKYDLDIHATDTTYAVNLQLELIPQI